MAAPWHAMEHFDLLLQEVIEQNDLIFELEACVVSFEEFLILLFELLPHQLREAGFNFELLLQLHDHLQVWPLKSLAMAMHWQSLLERIAHQNQFSGICHIMHMSMVKPNKMLPQSLLKQ